MSNSTPVAATLHFPDGSVSQPERLPSDSLHVGDGLYDGDRRYRIVDLWHSLNGSEPFNWGLHVWLEDVSGTSADRLLAEEPHHFA